MAVYQEFDDKGKVIKTKDGRSWVFFVRYKDFDGQTKQYKSQKFINKKEAKKAHDLYLAKYKSDMARAFTYDMTHKSYMENQKKKIKGSSYYTIENKLETNVLPYFKNKIVVDINLLDITHWKEEMDKKGLSIDYKNAMIGYFKATIKHVMIYYDIETNIINKVENYSKRLLTPASQIKKQINFWTYEEWEYFDEVIKKDEDLLYKSFFNVLYYGGLRKNEANALNWHDFDGYSLDITKTVTYRTAPGVLYEITTPKTPNSIRVVPLPDIVIDLLYKLKQEKMKYKNFDENMFIFGDFRPLPLTNIARKFQNYIDDAAINDIKPHDLRHSAVSLLINLGKNEYEIADRIGDTVEMIRKTYAHLFPKKRDELVAALNDISKAKKEIDKDMER